MARRARLIIPSLPHWVVQRGHNGQDVFLDDQDRRQYLAFLRDAAHEHRLDVHAYALGASQIQWLATPPDEIALARTTQSLGRRYVAWFNRRHLRSGTLWDGRFSTCIVDPDRELLTSQRHIELAGQEATLAPTLLYPPWTSVMHHLGQHRDPLITDHPAYWRLGNTPFERELAYGRWLAEGIGPGEAERVAAAWRHNGVLGDDDFIARLQAQAQRALTPRPRGRPRRSAASRD